MIARLTLDAAGRVVIPKGLREELHLQPGDELDMETSGDELTLRPVRVEPHLAKEQGVWVFRTGKPLAASVTDEVLARSRCDRDRTHLGPPK
jgi:AbrB family looped-hinge helix DNA binding protein